MSSAQHNLSHVHDGEIPSAKEMRFGIVVSEWNVEITGKLLTGAYNTLIKHEAKEKNIIVKWVPGSFELPLGAQLVADSHKVDAVICLGCVIRAKRATSTLFAARPQPALCSSTLSTACPSYLAC